MKKQKKKKKMKQIDWLARLVNKHFVSEKKTALKGDSTQRD